MNREALPVEGYLQDIRAAVQRSPAVVIEAQPGAGKTTRVPLALDEALSGKTLVLEPRRLAAKLTAQHMAAGLGQQVGERVGFQIRYERAISDASTVIFVTEGMFIRMLADNPNLDGVSCVVLDEFHERNLNTDIALGVVRYLQSAGRPDLRLVVMSATMDTSALKRYLGECEIFSVPGRQFPVEVEYHPGEERLKLGERVAEASAKMLADPRCDQSILVFLPGAKEIMEAQQCCLRKIDGAKIQVVPLMADLPPAKQRLAFDQSQRRIILATNVAETSLTIPGITGVIDTGTAKIAGHAHWSGMPTLQIKDVSQASVLQRGGRAGRVHPGVVYRLYDEASYLAREAYTLPEIKRVDLTSCALQILALRGAIWSEAEQFPWYEQPDERLWGNAFALLRRLGMVDAADHITDWGRRAYEVPLHPRHAAIFLSAVDAGEPVAGAWLAALISEGFLLKRLRFAADRRRCDLDYQLEILHTLINKKELSSQELMRSIDQRRVQSITRLAKMLLDRAGLSSKMLATLPPQDKLAEWVLQGYPDRVAKLRVLDKKRQKKQRQPMYHFCMGRGGVLGEQSVLSGKEAFIVAVDAQENLQQSNAAKSTLIRVASEVRVEQLLAQTNSTLFSQKQEERLHPQTGKPEVFRVTYYGEFILSEERLAEAGDPGQILARMLTQWPWPFPDQDALVRHNAKADLLKANGWSAQLTHFSGEMLELFIHSLVDDIHSVEDILARPLQDAILAQLSYEELELLRVVVPDKLRLDNGRELDVEYNEHGCALRGHIQDFFGVKESPTLLQGRCPIRLFLLAPNKRPAQVTTDLTGFWKTGYFEVKKELQRRYPRHYWPDDPAAAEPFLTKRQFEKGSRP